MNIVAVRSSLWCFAFLGAPAFGIPSAYADDAIKFDPALKGYVKVSGVSGNVNSIGSDSMNNLMTLWAEGFRKHYPNVQVEVEGKGSSDGSCSLYRRHRPARTNVPYHEKYRDRCVRKKIRI